MQLLTVVIGYQNKLARIGGTTSPLRPLPNYDSGNKFWVVYTTIQTLYDKICNHPSFFRKKPSLVVWDESHWGELAKTGKTIIKWCKTNGIPLLGLTATPKRPEVSEFNIAYSKDYFTLMKEGFLAEPKISEAIKTGISWSPELVWDKADFRPDSLNELAENEKRNKLIVEQYINNRESYGKTIIFACNIDHAETLKNKFTGYQGRGCDARVITSYYSTLDNKEALEDFKRGNVNVLINVAMLTHGIDVPDVQTIFMCRPTMSDILFSQMIGRGARRSADKT